MNYFDKKNKLITNNKKLKNIIETKLKQDTGELCFFEKELKNLNFNVLCLGDFGSGKSTFINNFFLENKVKLPVRATVTTAKLTVIKYGETLKIIVIMKDGTRSEIKNNIENSLDELVAAKGSKLESVELVEVQIPSNILKEGVVIVDSPGLNDPEIDRMNVTFEFLNQADCVLYFLSATSAWKNTEKIFLEEKVFSKEDIDKIFFLINSYDLIEDEEEQEDVLEYVKKGVSQSIQIVRNKIGNKNISIPKIIPISAKTGYNFDKLKHTLYDYLGDKKAQNILDIKTTKHNKIIQVFIKDIEERERLILKSKDDLKKEQDKYREELKEYQKKVKTIERRIRNSIINSYIEFVTSLSDEYKLIVDNFETNIRKEIIQTVEDFNKYYNISLKRSELSSSSSINRIKIRFKKNINDIFDKEKSNLNIPISKVYIDNDHLLNKLFNLEYNLKERNTSKENLAGAVGILGVFGLGGSGITLLTTTQGAIPAAWTWLTGTLVGTTATVSTASLIGIIATPVFIIGGIGYIALKNASKEKFKKELNKVIDDSVNNLSELYNERITELLKNEDNVAEIISQNITNEFIETYQDKLNQYEEVSKIKNDNLDKKFDFKQIKKEILELKIK